MSAGYYWQSMYRFRVLTVIITDNGTQLINKPFKSWAEGDQDKATPGGSRVGRRATECTIGSHDDAKNKQWGNPIQSSI
ncbi:hypothetical protein Tco_0527235 [Tanacetum coccineum]